MSWACLRHVLGVLGIIHICGLLNPETDLENNNKSATRYICVYTTTMMNDDG